MPIKFNGTTIFDETQISGKSIGEVYLSQSSLAEDNPGGLPLFTGETISNASNLYPQFFTWLGNHPELLISASNYESALTTYGECPYYVLDVVNTTIRLPKLTNYVKAANTTGGITQSSAGLPEVKALCNTANSNAWNNIPSYAEDVTNSNGYQVLAGSSIPTTTTLHYIESKASLSSSVYGNSNTVTPAHTTLYFWVHAYNGAVAASTAQAASFQQALTSKADKDLANITISAETVINELISSYLEPDYSAPVSIPAGDFTAPSDGWVLANSTGVSDGTKVTIAIDGTTYFTNNATQFNTLPQQTIYLAKGQTATITYAGYGIARFVPLKGASV